MVVLKHYDLRGIKTSNIEANLLLYMVASEARKSKIPFTSAEIKSKDSGNHEIVFWTNKIIADCTGNGLFYFYDATRGETTSTLISLNSAQPYLGILEALERKHALDGCRADCICQIYGIT